MTEMNRRSVLMVGAGSYLPSHVMTNDDLSEFVETDDSWIKQRTGIGQRHIVAEGEKTSDLAVHAAWRALENARLSAADIDIIIIATTTPDDTFPSTASVVQHKLEAYQAFAFDVQAVCAGFVYGLGVGDSLIKSGQGRRALIIGAESFTKLLNWKDRTTCVLFGDAAGAFVIESNNNSSDQSGIIDSIIRSDGQFRTKLFCDGGPSMIAKSNHYINMDGKEVYKHAVEKQTAVVEELLARTKTDINDIDWFVPHQANLRILDTTAKKLNLDKNKIIITVDRHANTSSASIPVAMGTAIQDGKIKKGDLVLLEAFGAGFTWGAVLLRY